MAGKSSKGGGKSAGKASKKNELRNRVQYTMRIVESDTCEVCKTPCTRGLQYLDRMRQPGAVGHGVPCILTRRAVT